MSRDSHNFSKIGRQNPGKFGSLKGSRGIRVSTLCRSEVCDSITDIELALPFLGAGYLLRLRLFDGKTGGEGRLNL